ncbi:MAG: LamG-like jellyroll fold domain-containing protein, partial [Candidatus Omnitrophota bacterium]
MATRFWDSWPMRIANGTITIIFLLVCSVAWATDYTQDANCKGAWLFEEGTGTSTTDSSPNSNTGNFKGTREPGWAKMPKSYMKNFAVFNGWSDFINVGSTASLDNMSPVTCVAWVYAETSGEGSKGTIFSKYDGVSGGNHYFALNGTALEYNVNYQTLDLFVPTQSGAFTLGQWNHVAVTWDGTTESDNVHIYVNGTEASYSTKDDGIDARLSDADVDMYLGVRNSLCWWDGPRGEMALFNRVLSLAEIQDIMNFGLKGPTDYTQDTNCQAAWLFTEGTGTTVADSSQNSNTGNFKGTREPGWGLPPKHFLKNNFVAFDEVDDYINAGSDASLDNMNPFSCVAWIYAETTGDEDRGVIFSKYNNTNLAHHYFALAYSGLAIEYNVDHQTQDMYVPTVNGVYNLGQWHHFAVTWDGSTESDNVHIYVDGVEVAYDIKDDGIDARLTDADGDFYIGIRRPTDPGIRMWDGLRGEMAVFSRVLSASEINEIMHKGLKGTATPPPNYTQDDTCRGAWLFTEGSGTSVADASGNSNTGNFKAVGEPAWNSTVSLPKTYLPYCVEYDSVDDVINCASNSTLDNIIPVSFVIWAYPDTDGETVKGTLFSKAMHFFSLNSVTNANAIEYDNYYATDGLWMITDGSDYTEDTWQHLAVTWDGSGDATNVEIYVNGAKMTHSSERDASGAHSSDDADNFLIGNKGDYRTWDGYLSECAVFARVLTQDEVKFIINHGIRGDAALFEDGFESGNLTKHWDSSSTSGTGNAIVAHADAIRIGSYGCRVTLAGAAGYAYAQEAVTAYDLGEIYVRFYFKFASGFTMGNTNEFNLLEITDSGGIETADVKLYCSGGDTYYLYLTQPTDGADINLPGAQTSGWPADKLFNGGWHSLEYHFKAGTGADGVAELFVDGADVANGADNYDMNSLGLKIMRVGALAADASTSGSIYIDDVKADDLDYIGAGALADNWLGINSAYLDSHCGDDTGYTLAEALNDTDVWTHTPNEDHWFILDLGKNYNIKKLRGRSNQLIDPTDVEIYISEDKASWGTAVGSNVSTWQDTATFQEVDTTDKIGRYIKVVVENTEDGNRKIGWGNASGFGDGQPIFDVYGSPAAEEFVCTIKQSGARDYSSLAIWEAAMQCDLTSAVTAEWDGQVGNNIADGTAVTWNGGSGTLMHMTTVATAGKNAFLIVTSNTLENNDVVTDGANSFVVNGTPLSAIAVAKIDGTWSSADTSTLTLTGWTTSATNYIKIYTTPTARHNGVWNSTSKYRLETSDANAINLEEEYVTFDGLQINVNTTSGYHMAFNGESFPSNNCRIVITNGIFKASGTLTTAIGCHFHGTPKVYCYNNIWYGWQYPGYGAFRQDVTGIFYYYNQTIYNCSVGIDGWGGGHVAKNCITQSCTAGFVNPGDFDSSSTHNLSEDGTAPPYNTYYTGKSVIFKDELGSPPDFHLGPTDIEARDKGTSLSSDANLPFSTDIDSESRPSGSSWDLGADEDDVTPPTIVDATLYDTDNDGYINEILIEFNENMKDSSITANTDAGQFTFGGVSCVGIDSTTLSGSGYSTSNPDDPDVANDKYMTIFTNDTSVFGTGLRDVTFTAASNKFEDANGNDLATTSTVTEIDKAKPVLVDVFMYDAGPTSGVCNDPGDILDLVFSETLSALPSAADLDTAIRVAGVNGDDIPTTGTDGNYSLETTTFTNDTVVIIFGTVGGGWVANADAITLGEAVDVVVGTNITDTASNPANTSATAQNAGATTIKLAFTTQPSSSATAGSAFSQQPTVQIQDNYGNTITTDSTTNITIQRGSKGTAPLQGSTLTLQASAGSVTFSGLSYNIAETINLRAYDSSHSAYVTQTSDTDFAGTLTNTVLSGTGNAAYLKLANKGTVSFGNAWKGVPIFFFPHGIAIDTVNNKLYIADTSYHRIVRMDSGTGGTTFGKDLETFGSGGSGANQFSSPRRVCIDKTNNKLYVADTGNHRVVRFDLATFNGTNWATYGTGPNSGVGNFNNPWDIAVDVSGNKIYVSDTTNNRIVKFDLGTFNGTNWATYGTSGSGVGNFSNPRGLYFDAVGAKIYVADDGNSRVIRFDTATFNGTGWQNFGVLGSGANQFTNPYEVAADNSGNNKVYVVDAGNDRIVRFALDSFDGTGWETVGTTGSDTAEFNTPKSLCLDVPRNKIYVTEGHEWELDSSQRVVRFDLSSFNGTNWETFGFHGLNFTHGLYLDNIHNKLYVTDSGYDRIARFDSGGGGTVFGANFEAYGTEGTGTGNFSEPWGVFADVAGNKVYVADTVNDRIVRFDLDTFNGTNWQAYGVNGTGVGNFQRPRDIFVDYAGNKIYIADETNHRIVRINRDTFNDTGWTTIGTGTAGSGVGQFNTPRGIDLDFTNDKIYVGDQGNNRVVRFKLSTFDTTDWASVGGFSQPNYVSLDVAKNSIYVMGGGNKQVTRINLEPFDGSGWTNGFAGGTGTGVGWLNWPRGVEVDTVNQKLYASDSANHRIAMVDTGLGTNTLYEASGTYESTTIDLTSARDLSRLSWNIATQPELTAVSVRVAAKAADSGWQDSDYLDLENFTGNSGDIPTSLDGNRYVRYKIAFTAYDINLTPRIEDVTLEYVSSGSIFTSALSADIVVAPTSVDHYTVSTTTPQYYGVGWYEFVKGYDTYNNLVTNDSSTVVTMSDSGNALFYTSPTYATTTTTYTLASGGVTVYPKDNIGEITVITATSTGGKTGNSNNIYVYGLASVTATGDGDWSSTTPDAPWPSGIGPSWNTVVTIPNGSTVTFDRDDTYTTCSDITIASGGELIFDTGSDVTMQVNGDLTVNGTLSLPANPGYTTTLIIECASAGEHGVIVNDGGSFSAQGSAKDVATVTTSAITGGVSNSFTVGAASDIEGWQTGDEITVAMTVAWAGTDQTERQTIQGIAGTTVTIVAANFTNNHSIGAQVCNITRNCKITASNASYNGYIENLNTVAANFDMDYVEVSEMGIDAAGKYGITFNGAGTRGTIDYCSIHNGLRGIRLSSSSDNTLTNNILYSNTWEGFDGEYGSNNNTLINNSVLSNGWEGICFYFNNTGNTISGSNCYANSRPNIILGQSSNNNTIINNDCHSCPEAGITVTENSDYNTLKDNTSYLNSWEGISIWDGCDGNLMINNTCYSNSRGIYFEGNCLNNTAVNEDYYSNSYGIRTENSTGNLVVNSQLGTSGANTSGDIQYSSGSTSNLILKDCDLDSGTEVATSGIDSANSYLISYNQDGSSGIVKLWGDYALASTAKFNYSEQLYDASYTTPKLMKGTGHSITNVATSASTLTELITVTYDGTDWDVTGSVSGALGSIAAAGGHFTSTGNKVQFDLTVGTAATGDYLDFLTLAASGDANTQKKLEFGPCNASLNSGKSKITVTSAGTLEFIGAVGSPTLIDKITGGNAYSLLCNGAFRAENYNIQNADAVGLQFGSTAVVSELSYGTFDNAGAASAAYITVDATCITADKIFIGCVFDADTSDSNAQYNVTTSGSSSNFWRFTLHSGNKDGEANDNDDTDPGIIRWDDSTGVNHPPANPDTLYTHSTNAQSGDANPTNISSATPHFSAIYDDPDTSDTAISYRIQVDNNQDFSSPLWDGSDVARFLWGKRLGGSGTDYGFKLASDTNGNIILGGIVSGDADLNGDADTGDNNEEPSATYGGYDAIISVFNSSGDYQWSKRLGGTSNDYAKIVRVDSNNNILVAGYAIGNADLNGDGDSTDGGYEDATGFSGLDVIVTVFNSSGTYQWSKRLGGSGEDFAYGIAAGSNNDVIVVGKVVGDADLTGDGDTNDTGETTSGTYGDRDGFISVFTSAGVPQWSRRLGGTGWDNAEAAIANSDGDVFIIGYIVGNADLNGNGNSTDGGAEDGTGFGGSSDIFITVFTSSGTHRWMKRLGGLGWDQGYASALFTNDYIAYIGDISGTGDLSGDGDTNDDGETTSATYGSGDFFITVFDSDGAYQWSKRLGGTGEDYAYGIAADANNNVIGIGHVNQNADLNGNGNSTDGGAESNTGYGSNDIAVSAFTSTGTHIWAERLGGAGYDTGEGITKDLNNNIIVTGMIVGDADINGDADRTDAAESDGGVYGTDTSDVIITKFNSTGNNIADVNENARSADIIYNGATLADATQYYWRLKFYDNSGYEGDWSLSGGANHFTTQFVSYNPNTWTGADPGNDNWSDPDNWYDSTVPVAGDAVYFHPDFNVSCAADTVNNNLASITMEAGYTGTVTFAVDAVANGMSLTVTGDITVNSGNLAFAGDTATDSIPGGVNDGTGYTVNAANITIASGGSINENYQGFAGAAGPGSGGSSMGGTYGGIGGENNDSTYGSVTSPTSLGSGGAGGYTGGGAITLNTTNTLTVNGTITANGQGNTGSNNNGGGSGGSINITCTTLAGNGTICADAGSAGSVGGGGGGGGRISLVNVTTNNFEGRLSVVGGGGGQSRGYAGTIAFPSNYDLEVGGATNPYYVILGTDSTPYNYSFNSITVNANGELYIDGNPNLNLVNGVAQGTSATISAANVTINSGSPAGKLSADGLGFSYRHGPGAGTSNQGGTYGGIGINSTASTYGLISDPINLGSGGSSHSGGGAIILNVTNTLTVNGTLSANGLGNSGENYNGGGSGGSIKITCATIAGSGTLSAGGGSGGSVGGAGGGGGRVYLAYSVNTSDTITKSTYGGYGGAGYGAAGTIVLRDTDIQTYGDLTVNNNNIDTTVITYIPSINFTGTPPTLTFDSITVKNKARLKVPGANKLVSLSAINVGTTASSADTAQIIAGNVFGATYTPASWYGTAGWPYRQVFVIDESKIDADLTDFPVMVKQVTGAHIFGKAQSDHDDILFTASDGTTKLDHEIEKYVDTSGSEELIAHVEIPSVSATANTIFYMYYGNLSASNQENVTGAWSNGYISVWHLCEDPGPGGAGDIKDSLNVNNGTAESSMTTEDLVNGAMNGSIDFDGTDDYIQTTSAELKTANNFTVTAWFNVDATDYAHHIIWEGDGAGNGFGTQAEMHLCIGEYYSGAGNNDRLCFFLGDRDETADAGSLQVATAFSDTTNWHFAVATVSNLDTSPAAELFLDGASVETDTGTLARTTRTSWNTNLRIGRVGTAQRYFDGIIDEVRIANTVRSIAWIKAEYNSGKNTLLFSDSGVIIRAANVNIYGSSGAGASINTDSQGYAKATGKGPGGVGSSGHGAGAGYGGAGGASGDGGTGGSTYGSATNPVDLGSGGGSVEGGTGGGAIFLDIDNTLTVAGFLASDGNAGANGASYDGGGGSGGSIKAYISTLSGAGIIRANGGAGADVYGGGGGGGRIFISCATNSFTGTTQVNGGAKGSNPGAGAGANGTQTVSNTYKIWTNNSGDGLWATAGNWSCRQVPQAGDTVIFNSSSTANCTAAVNTVANNLVSITLDTGYTGTLTFQKNAVANGMSLTTTGNITVNSGNFILEGDTTVDSIPGTPENDGTGYTINAANITVASGASINADGKGFPGGFTGQGPGAGGNNVGGTYGGVGNNNSKSTYGSVTNPTSLGSGGYADGGGNGYGGGAIILNITNTLTVNGILSANGISQYSGGSGGSLNITTNTLSGSGTIEAK